MCWYQDKTLLNNVLDYACVKLSDKDRQTTKDRCVKIITEEKCLKKALIHVLYTFPSDPPDIDKRNYIAERFFEKLYDMNLLDTNLLSIIFISLWQMRRPFQYFPEPKLKMIFDDVKKPLLDIKTKNKIQELPEEFTIYRGIRGESINKANIGFSWSLSQHTASKFATGDNQCNGFICKGNASRKDIIAYFNFRCENEIVILPENVKDICSHKLTIEK